MYVQIGAFFFFLFLSLVLIRVFDSGIKIVLYALDYGKFDLTDPLTLTLNLTRSKIPSVGSTVRLDFFEKSTKIYVSEIEVKKWKI